MDYRKDSSNENNKEEGAECLAICIQRQSPSRDYSHLLAQLEQLIVADINASPKRFRPADIESIKSDAWTIERFLLKTNFDVDKAHKLILKVFEFRNSPLVSCERSVIEFYQSSAIFVYEPDRCGNVAVYIRLRVYRKVASVTEHIKAFIYNKVDEADRRAKGRGIVLVFDMQESSVSNIDLKIVSFITKIVNELLPLGTAYLLFHEMHFLLQPIWTIISQGLGDELRSRVKFSNSATIARYFDRANLPDFMGGTCQVCYRQVPDDAMTFSEAAKLWSVPISELIKMRKKYADFVPPRDWTPDELAAMNGKE